MQQRNIRRFHRNPTTLLHFQKIQDPGRPSNLSRQQAGFNQKRIRQSRLPMVNMRHNTHIADPLLIPHHAQNLADLPEPRHARNPVFLYRTLTF
jgi:hypothetical protein